MTTQGGGAGGVGRKSLRDEKIQMAALPKNMMT